MTSPPPIYLAPADCRSVDRATIIDMLLLLAWPHEVRAGEEERARELAERALDRWCGEGLPHDASAAELLFDPFEVQNFMVWSGRVRGDRIWWDHRVESGRRMLRAERLAPGLEPGPLPPRERTLLLRRELSVAERPAGAAVRLSITLPRAEPGQASLVVAAHGPEGSRCKVDAGVADLRATATGSATIPIDLELRFASGAAVSPEPASTAAERELYTNPVEGMLRVTDELRATARDVAGARAGREAIGALWSFLFQTMNVGAMHHGTVDGLDPLGALLAGSWCDCYGAAALLAGLCRAIGTPARVVSGILLQPLLLQPHFWNEIWIEGEGWRPFDLAMSWHVSGGDVSSPWSRLLFGRVEPRLVIERLPRTHIGLGGRLPPWWHLVPRLTASGTETTFRDARSGELVYRDTIALAPESAGS